MSTEAQNRLLDLLRAELNDPTLTLEQAQELPLGKRMFDAAPRLFSTAPAASPSESSPPTPLGTFQNSEAVIAAALEDHFEISNMGATDQERNALLASSNVVTVDGKRFLRLTDQNRAEVLKYARGGTIYQSMLSSSGTKLALDAAPSSTMWLRRFLRGEVIDLDNLPLDELKAAYEARGRLRLVELPRRVPSVDNLARRFELAEFLEPLRMLVGAQGGFKGETYHDHFVGRESELGKLRMFVDELASKGWFEALNRLASRAARTVLRNIPPGLMTIEARGGLGKSTLLAKFVLDHALNQRRPFPFAYLDFDRADIDPERPRQLLIEIARQVRLQFPPAYQDFNRLIADLRAENVDPTSRSSSADGEIQNPFSRFVEILRRHATLEGRRAFLLVFDTLEVVQWDNNAMDRLASFVTELRQKGLDELKLVASGRAEVSELGANVPSVSLQLKPLSIADAKEMANTLGEGALGRWKSQWSAAIVGSGYKEESRREPLAVRVAVDLFARAEGDRDELADQICKNGPDSNVDFVAWIYEKRIVDHVRDGLARKLAWPGLIVRRVTVEIIRELLASVCDIAPEDAERAFNALGNEVWMVTREAGGLRHRPDLRARTLPLMQKHNEKKFMEVAKAAVKYFGRHRERSREDRAEWIYHRLLLKEPLAEVAKDFNAELLPLLARAEDDFFDNPEAASYLASRNASKRLPNWRLHNLLPVDALHHLKLRSTGAFALDDVDIDKSLLDVANRLASNDLSTSEETAWARTLWIKTGMWRRLSTDPFNPEMTKPQWRAHLYWAIRVAPTLDVAKRQHLYKRCLLGAPWLAGRGERLGVRAAVQLMAFARMFDATEFEALDRSVKLMFEQSKSSPVLLPSLQSAFRTAIVFGESCRKPALRQWLMSRRRSNIERVFEPTMAGAELDTLTRLIPRRAEMFGLMTAERFRPARIAEHQLVASVHSLLDEMLADSSEQGDDILHTVTATFAQRSEDWTIPLGYAAARATRGRLSEALKLRVKKYDLAFQSREKRPRSVKSLPLSVESPPRAVESPRDILSAMIRADEAGDLAGFAHGVRAECDASVPETAELDYVLHCFDAWSSEIRNLVELKAPISAHESTQSDIDGPPEPGPILNSDDPQKGRWGGKPARDGRIAKGILESVERDTFYFSVVVESTDGSELMLPVVFHMHDSYPRSIVKIRHIIDRKQARLTDWQAYGVSTVGVQVKNANGRWISLEFDLSRLSGLPSRFLDR